METIAEVLAEENRERDRDKIGASTKRYIAKGKLQDLSVGEFENVQSMKSGAAKRGKAATNSQSIENTPIDNQWRTFSDVEVK